MQLLTIVEYYINALMERAVGEELEDGTIFGTVPDVPGMVAYGADPHECARALYVRLEEWVKLSLARSQRLPVVDEIDLNSDAGRILSSYHDLKVHKPSKVNYVDEDGLEALLDQWEKQAS